MDESSAGPDGADLIAVRQEIRSEIGLLHDRVNALLAAEAFLTIAYTSAMGNTATWGKPFAAVVSPVLAGLGLLLAVLAWPGITATVHLVLSWTAQHDQSLARDPGLWPFGRQSVPMAEVGPRQRRSMLFFRAVPVLFAVVWLILAVVAVVATR